ncbi:MAG: N-acetylneuraminate synthase family protein [Planctomycetota bacterium]|jgi:sialic acid synthase SpsE
MTSSGIAALADWLDPALPLDAGPPLVVAEIGNNHEGDVDLAVRLIELAADAGAGAVKFQTFRAERFVRGDDTQRFEQMRRFELGPADFERLAKRARDLGLLFLSTPLDLESVGVLEGLVDGFKIASGDLTFTPLLERVAATGSPVILSSGLADLDLLAEALAVVRGGGGNALAVGLLHCVSAYPVPEPDANLRAITTMQGRFDEVIGYSDHTVGVRAATLAAALGARIIEKHFTIAHDYSAFRDHALSATPEELRRLVEWVRHDHRLLGDGTKSPRACERGMETAIRRSIRLAVPLEAGTIIEAKHLVCQRPGDGLAPREWPRLTGRTLRCAVAAGTALTEADLSDGGATGSP